MWWLVMASGAWSQTLSVGQLNAGDLVITEVMQDPTAVADASGEWFELRNTRAQPVDLFGLEVSDLGVDFTTVNSSVVVAAGAYAVIGVSADTGMNGGVTVNHAMSITLANADDELILSASGFVIDEIRWDGGINWPDPSGASMALDSSALTAAANDNGLNWCEGTVAFGAGDLGTPGAANPSCAGGTGVGTGGGTGGGVGTGAGTGGGTGAGTGTGFPTDTGGLTGGSGTGTGDGSGTGGGGTAATGTGTGASTPEYNKLGCGCTSGQTAPSGALVLALPLLGLGRRRT